MLQESFIAALRVRTALEEIFEWRDSQPTYPTYVCFIDHFSSDLCQFFPSLVTEQNLWNMWHEFSDCPDVLPVIQQRVSKHWRKLGTLTPTSSLATIPFYNCTAETLLPLYQLSSSSMSSGQGIMMKGHIAGADFSRGDNIMWQCEMFCISVNFLQLNMQFCYYRC